MCTDRYRCMSFIHKHTLTLPKIPKVAAVGVEIANLGWRIQTAFDSMFSAARIESQTYQSRRCSTSLFKRMGPFIRLIAWYSLCCQVDYKCPTNQSCVLLLPELSPPKPEEDIQQLICTSGECLIEKVSNEDQVLFEAQNLFFFLAQFPFKPLWECQLYSFTISSVFTAPIITARKDSDIQTPLSIPASPLKCLQSFCQINWCSFCILHETTWFYPKYKKKIPVMDVSRSLLCFRETNELCLFPPPMFVSIG